MEKRTEKEKMLFLKRQYEQESSLIKERLLEAGYLENSQQATKRVILTNFISITLWTMVAWLPLKAFVEFLADYFNV